MGKVRTFLSLSPSEFYYTFVLTLLVIAAQLKIFIFSGEAIFRSLQVSPPANLSGRKKFPLPAWLRLLEAVDRNLGKPSCLRRAIVLVWLGRMFKIPMELKIGAKRDGGDFQAHAWLESEGLRLEVHPSPAFHVLEKEAAK